MSEKEQDIYDAVAEFREKNPEPKAVDVTLWEACRVVEEHLRGLGGRLVSVYIKPEYVEVGAIEWPYDAAGKTFFDALMTAKERGVRK